MIVVLTISIIALLFAYLSSYKRYVIISLFRVAFILVTVLQIIHYDYGFDYMAYVSMHEFIGDKSIDDLVYLYEVRSGYVKDIGWVALNWLLPSKMGFFLLVTIISIIQNMIYYKFIKDFLRPNQWWQAIAIYLFQTGFYLLNFSALRQGFAVSLWLMSVMLYANKKIIKSIFLCVFASTIHASAIVVIPFLILFKCQLKNGRRYANIFIFTTITLFLFTPIVGFIFEEVMGLVPILTRNYAHYRVVMKAAGTSFGLGALLNSVMFIVILYFMFFKFDNINHTIRVLMIFTCVLLLLLPFQMNITGIISRVASYFSVFQIVLVPTLYNKIRDNITRFGVSFVYTFMMIYQWYLFMFVTEWSSNSYRTFQTIFSQIF